MIEVFKWNRATVAHYIFVIYIHAVKSSFVFIRILVFSKVKIVRRALGVFLWSNEALNKHPTLLLLTSRNFSPDFITF